MCVGLKQSWFQNGGLESLRSAVGEGAVRNGLDVIRDEGHARLQRGASRGGRHHSGPIGHVHLKTMCGFSSCKKICFVSVVRHFVLLKMIEIKT